MCPITKIFHIFSLGNIYHALSGTFTHFIFSDKCSSKWLTVSVLIYCRVRQASEYQVPTLTVRQHLLLLKEHGFFTSYGVRLDINMSFLWLHLRKMFEYYFHFCLQACCLKASSHLYNMFIPDSVYSGCYKQTNPLTLAIHTNLATAS